MVVAFFSGAMKTSRLYNTTSKSNAFLECLFDAITDPVIVFDTELRIMIINKAASPFFPEYPVGKKCFTIKHTMAPICKDCPAWQSIRTGKSALANAKIYDPDTGHTLHIETYPILDNAGAVNAVAVIGRVNEEVKMN